MADKIRVRDDKLLRRESYIRRERHVCFGLCILCAIGAIIVPVIDQGRMISERDTRIGFATLLFLLGYAYFCTLRIRHIESIKTYRSRSS